MYSCLAFAANADWREELGTLRIGILAGDDVSRSIAFVEPFRLAIQEKLNVDVEIYGARDYPTLVQAHTTGRVEYAVLSATAYAASYKVCKCNEPLVVAKSGDGKNSFQSILIGRQGGVISLNDINGKQAIALSKDSVGGYAYPLYELAENGFELAKSGVTFSFGETSSGSVELFSQGQGDVMLGWSSLTGDATIGFTRGTLKELENLRPGSASQYKVIWKSTPIPHRVHSIVTKIPTEAKKELRELLEKMFDDDPVAYDAIEPIYGGGFTSANQRIFNQMIKFVSAPRSALPR